MICSITSLYVVYFSYRFLFLDKFHGFVCKEAPVNIADLAKGCYIVKITMGNTDKAMKFIKK